MNTTNNILSVYTNGSGATVKYNNSQGKNNHAGELPIHDDFKNALRALDIHFCFLTGQVPVPTMPAFNGLVEPGYWSFDRVKETLSTLFDDSHERTSDWEQAYKQTLENMTCSGFIFKGTSERGVQLTGIRLLDYCEFMKGIEFVSPTQKFMGDVYDYPYLSELQDAVNTLAVEADLYVFGKNGAVKQGELDFEQEYKSDDVAVTEPLMIEGPQKDIEQPKKGRKPKEIMAAVEEAEIVHDVNNDY
jgi:hypothetical protein